MTTIRYYLLSALILIFAGISLQSCLDTTSPDLDSDSDSYSHKLNPGVSANDFLADSNFTDLVVEIDYMPGHEPTQEGLDSLKTFLQRRLNKQSISFRTPTEISSGEQSSYSADEIRTLEEENRNHFTESGDNTLQAYFLMVDGEYSPNSNVLGIAYWNTSVAFFGAKMEEISGTPPAAPSEEKIEGTVFRHEFGHNMGLVGNGTPIQSDHKTDGSAHCTNDGCLMEPAVRTTDFFSNFTGSIPPLKEFCIEDLQANGGK